MTLRSFLLVPDVRQVKRRKRVYELPVWKLIDTETGKTRCIMTDPQDVETIIEALLLADRLKRNCANVGLFQPEMIEQCSFSE